MGTTKKFKAEIKQVLDLVIHSLYSKKEIFLRELISNSSDAIDRAKYLALTDQSIAPENPEYGIHLIADKEAHTLIIEDNGVGMDAAELEDSLGTIAKSGTKAFSEALKNKENTNIPEMIGQFGVGFYAAFMVADSVSVETLRRGTDKKPVRWVSMGDGDYTIEDGSRETCGTTITLHLRDDQFQFAEEWTLKDLVRRYSDFISYPITLNDEKEPLNTMRAIWKRSKSEIKPEEYTAFYEHLSHDNSEPLNTLHISAEGVMEYKAILFIPKKGSMELMMPTHKRGLSLYVRNVFIGNEFEQLIPEYLRFVKGIVDSSDLPLNVSRELLQDDAVIRKIKTDLTNRVLKALTEMAKDKPEDFSVFTAAFGDILKEGLHTDWENKDKLKELIRYNSLNNDGKLISFREYKDAMPEGQKAIYALVADSIQTAKISPCLEALKKKGYDVIFMTSPIDQWIADGLGDYDKTPIQFIDKDELDLGESDDEKKQTKIELDATAQAFKPLTDAITTKLAGDIKEVRITQRLTDSPCCLVEDKNAMSPSMVRMMKAMGQDVPKQLRIMEINPNHSVIKNLREIFTENSENPEISDKIDLLYGQALLAEGSELPDAGRFIKLISELMQK